MIISQLWEFHFLAAAGLTLTATILVVSVLRLLLQRWASLWPKTIVVHLANLVVLLLAGQSIYALYPPTEFAYIPRGSIIVFAIVMMIADGLSRWWNVHHGAAQFTLRPTGLAILLGGAVLAVGAMRATADAERGKSDLDFAFWAVRTHAALTRQPEWEAWEALRHAFPREGAAIYEDYILETRMANGGNPAGQWLAPFPARKFKAIIMAHRGAIAKAPAVDVLRLGRAALAGARDLDCSLFVDTPNTARRRAEAAPPDMEIRFSHLLASALLAIREGIEHPVVRSRDPAKLSRLNAAFITFAPADVRRSLGKPMLPPLPTCKLEKTMLLWMAQLSDEDLIYVVATSPGHGLDALEYPGMPTPTQ